MTEEKVTFELADWASAEEQAGLNYKHYQQQNERGVLYIRAVMTGEHRPPMAGEWYLSGAIVEAYKALGDLTVSYPIAKLVLVRKVTRYELVEE